MIYHSLPCGLEAGNAYLPPGREGGAPQPVVVIAPALMVICIKTYRCLAKMGLVLERGAHFQKGCVSHCLFKYTPPLGAPAATFKATTNNAAHCRD